MDITVLIMRHLLHKVFFMLKFTGGQSKMSSDEVANNVGAGRTAFDSGEPP